MYGWRRHLAASVDLETGNVDQSHAVLVAFSRLNDELVPILSDDGAGLRYVQGIGFDGMGSDLAKAVSLLAAQKERMLFRETDLRERAAVTLSIVVQNGWSLLFGGDLARQVAIGESPLHQILRDQDFTSPSRRREVE